eukprot:3326198-Pleurochrysis_carterae.AAC.1
MIRIGGLTDTPHMCTILGSLGVVHDSTVGRYREGHVRGVDRGRVCCVDDARGRRRVRFSVAGVQTERSA